MATILRDAPLDWRGVAEVADGGGLALSPAAWAGIDAAALVVTAIAERGMRAYGISTGVGALSETVVDRSQQARLSRNLIMSHAAGVGESLGAREVRAILAAQINNYAHGRSGVRPALVEALLGLLALGCLPEVPSRGSVGYLTHMAHVGLVLIGEGRARVGGQAMDGGAALLAIGQEPLVLRAKEGLSLVNGTPCATGLACVALGRIERLLDVADGVAALTFEALGAGTAAIDAEVLAVRVSPGLQVSGAAVRARLADGPSQRQPRTQDALSLRAVPHVHGAARDAWAAAAAVVNRELRSVTDNPIVSGTPEAPVVASEAHAVAAALAMALDGLAVAVAQIAAMSERRFDRMLHPAFSGLPPFLAAEPGVASGYMIAQYTAAALVAENRRLAAPASLDGGITSALQEDFLAHPTSAATKLLAIIDNAEHVLGMELLAGADAHDLSARTEAWAPGTAAILRQVRSTVPVYRDDRPIASHLAAGRDLVRTGLDGVPGPVSRGGVDP